MKIINYSILIIICLAYFSCSSEESEIFYSHEFEDKNVAIKELNYYPLEIPSTSSYLIPDQVLINEDLDAVVIYDDLSTIIHRFHLNGTYVSSIGGEGEAPFEYAGVDDMKLDADGNLYVYSVLDMKFNTYRLDGEFVNYKGLNFYGKNFEILNNSFVFNTGYNFSEISGRNVLLQYDYDFKLLSRKFETPIDPRVMSGISGFFTYDSKNELGYFSHGMSDTIHIVNNLMEDEFSVVIDEVEKVWPHGFDYIKFLEDPKAVEYSWISDYTKIVNANLFVTIYNNRYSTLTAFDFGSKTKLMFPDGGIIDFLSNYMVSSDSDENIYYCVFTDETLSRVMEGNVNEMIDQSKYPELYELLTSNKLNAGPYIYRFKLI